MPNAVRNLKPAIGATLLFNALAFMQRSYALRRSAPQNDNRTRRFLHFSRALNCYLHATSSTASSPTTTRSICRRRNSCLSGISRDSHRFKGQSRIRRRRIVAWVTPTPQGLDLVEMDCQVPRGRLSGGDPSQRAQEPSPGVGESLPRCLLKPLLALGPPAVGVLRRLAAQAFLQHPQRALFQRLRSPGVVPADAEVVAGLALVVPVRPAVPAPVLPPPGLPPGHPDHLVPALGAVGQPR